ncbi:hypothetical protein PUN28_013694 [Cardiocondyla obscurior]|uniref:Uncharacterized protein n=1 Tax=Cardiocondyla obscurior TaxID=286306 RepID=A0AAW2F6N2_9HYME
MSNSVGDQAQFPTSNSEGSEDWIGLAGRRFRLCVARTVKQPPTQMFAPVPRELPANCQLRGFVDSSPFVYNVVYAIRREAIPADNACITIYGLNRIPYAVFVTMSYVRLGRKTVFRGIATTLASFKMTSKGCLQWNKKVKGKLSSRSCQPREKAAERLACIVHISKAEVSFCRQRISVLARIPVIF